jgi:2-succinyl-5-enolpyruvyl-6-hydroxy-3-cyclohexene-1-carboxylate synthase
MSLTVVVVDNDGGGIFSFLPQAAGLPGAVFERYWGTPHGIDPVAVAAAYGIHAHEISTRAALDDLTATASKPGVRIGVVRSDRQANVAVHDRIHAAIAAAI